MKTSSSSGRQSLGRQLKKKKKEMNQDIVLLHSRFNGTLRTCFVLLGNSWSSTTKTLTN